MKMGIVYYRNDGKSEVYYEGCVIAIRERNFHDDSDFYAIVYDAEKDAIDSFVYDSTRWGGNGDAIVDATPEILEKAKMAWIRDQIKSGALKRRLELEAAYPSIGKTVKVVRGRTDKGFVGEIFWMREYVGHGYKKYIRVGIRDEGGNVVWGYHRNVDVINPEQVSDEIVVDYINLMAEKGAYKNPNMMSNVLKGRALNCPVITG